jgi:hypothetical protein
MSSPAAGHGPGQDAAPSLAGMQARGPLQEAGRQRRHSPSRSQVSAFVRLGRPRFLLNSLLLVTLGMSMAAYEGLRLNVAGWVLALLFAWCGSTLPRRCG